MFKTFILILLLIPSISWANWSEEKLARELVFASTLINDWKQTLDIAKDPHLFETNKLLGRKPHEDNINIYFAGCLIGHIAIAYILPENLAKIWQNTWSGIESIVSDSNVKLGLNEAVNIEYRLTHTIKF